MQYVNEIYYVNMFKELALLERNFIFDEKIKFSLKLVKIIQVDEKSLFISSMFIEIVLIV